ncbi:hypothetical protein [Halorarum salinum]|uniref:hypothetical protein n=1 Tax=Halorarum salinum TaxID=2743089 RepID=UPI003742B46D
MILLLISFAVQTHGGARKAVDLVHVASELVTREGDPRIHEESVRDTQEKVKKTDYSWSCVASAHRRNSAYSHPRKWRRKPTAVQPGTLLVSGVSVPHLAGRRRPVPEGNLR